VGAFLRGPQELLAVVDGPQAGVGS
jgi:hypothetical protein